MRLRRNLIHNADRRRIFIYEVLFIYLFSSLGVVANILFAIDPIGYVALLNIIPSTCILVTIGQLFLHHKRLWYGLLYVGFGVTGIVYVSHLALYGATLDPESSAAILSTNSQETVEWVRSFANWRLGFALIFFLVAPYPLFRKIRGFRGLTRWELVALTMLVLLYLPTAAVRAFQTPFRPLFAAEVITNMNKAYTELSLVSELASGYPTVARATYPGEQTLICLVGESANRNHMHLYGYERQTTPYSEKLDRLYAFDDVISPAPTTQRSLGYMLTFASLANKRDYKSTVFDLFRKAGFKTWWISAQYTTEVAVGKGIVPILARRADVQWATTELPSDQRYDEFLLPVIRDAVADSAPRKLIIVQILGSHTQYSERLPPHRQWMRFTEIPPGREKRRALASERLEEVENIVNDYDTSILYTDWVASQVLGMTEDSFGPGVTVLYVADHGEEVFDSVPHFGHAGSSQSENVYEIPMLLRMSPHYQHYLATSRGLVFVPSRPYQTDGLIHTLIDLAAIDTPLYDAQRSLLSQEFKEYPRTIKGSLY